jgi:hypothetical protein
VQDLPLRGGKVKFPLTTKTNAAILITLRAVVPDLHNQARWPGEKVI